MYILLFFEQIIREERKNPKKGKNGKEMEMEMNKK